MIIVRTLVLASVNNYLSSIFAIFTMLGAVCELYPLNVNIRTGRYTNNNNNDNNGRNGSCLTWMATSLEKKRRWHIINASPRGQCSKSICM